MFIIPEGDNDPSLIYDLLVASCDEFYHLRQGEPDVRWLLKTSPVIKQGRLILGTVFMPSVQGQLKPLFDWFMVMHWGVRPDYLVILDADYWFGVNGKSREILVYHEMSHMAQKTDAFGAPTFNKETGKPNWTLIGHDVEEFVQVVKRYGAHSDELVALIEASKRTSP